ncbi:MAG: glycosyltransferase family 4 protein [Candidatus Brocadia sp.]|nr:glycosyltransferase family 4 protein [Candidatus Brocadia sp.]
MAMKDSGLELQTLRGNKSLKITYVLPVYWPAVGGCELHTHELVKILSERHNINVITLIDNQKDKLSYPLWVACILKAPARAIEYTDNHAKVTRLPLSRIEKYVNAPLARIQSPKLPDIFVRLAMERLSNFYMKKLITRIRGSDVLHCVHGGVSYLGYGAFKAARKLGIPFIYTPVLHLCHKNWLKEMKESMVTKKPFFYNPRLHLTPRGWTDYFWHKMCVEADVLIAMTDFEKNFHIQNGIHAEKVHKIGVGPLIADGPTPDFRQKYGLLDKKIVLFLGRNVESKGIEILLMATRLVWKNFPDTHFIFAGPKEENSEDIFQRYRDQRIHVLGTVLGDEKTALLKACDIFCMPSLEESLGGTFLEALVFEKPIIGAKIPPLTELTNNGEGGVLVNPVPEDIAEKILMLLQHPEIGNRMGQCGKKRVLDNYTWEIITKKMEDIYHDCSLTKSP